MFTSKTVIKSAFVDVKQDFFSFCFFCGKGSIDCGIGETFPFSAQLGLYNFS